jgi:hypothetical protein
MTSLSADCLQYTCLPNSCCCCVCVQAVAGAALQSLLAAAARPLLQVPPGKRSADEVECLAELLAGLEVSLNCKHLEMCLGHAPSMCLWAAPLAWPSSVLREGACRR